MPALGINSGQIKAETGLIGGFPPATGEVVQKSASGTSGCVKNEKRLLNRNQPIHCRQLVQPALQVACCCLLGFELRPFFLMFRLAL
jgi:hypothetical protein